MCSFRILIYFWKNLIKNWECLCSHEAVELRDDDKAVYMGKGVLKAVANVNEKIAPAIMGMDPTQQAKIDRTMMEVDKTENKVCIIRFKLETFALYWNCPKQFCKYNCERCFHVFTFNEHIWTWWGRLINREFWELMLFWPCPWRYVKPELVRKGYELPFPLSLFLSWYVPSFVIWTMN